MLESRRDFLKNLTVPRKEEGLANDASKSPLERTATRRDFIKILGVVTTALAIPETLYARKEKEASFVTPEVIRAMVLADNAERVFIALPESPHKMYEVTNRNLKRPAFARGIMLPEIEKLIEKSDGFIRIHTHPLGLYTIAGYSTDEIMAAREGLMPIPLSVPPSISDLLSAKQINKIQAMGEEPLHIIQEIYGTDGLWRFSGGGDSTLFTEIEQVQQELTTIFWDFQQTLPAHLRESYNKIIHLAENEGDARQGLICSDINELAKNSTLAPFLPSLEEKIAKLALHYKAAFACMEEINMLSMEMTHTEKRDAAMRRYFEITEKEGFQIKFEPYETTGGS